MTIEVAGAIAVASLIWAIYCTIKTTLLEDKIAYLRDHVERIEKAVKRE